MIEQGIYYDMPMRKYHNDKNSYGKTLIAEAANSMSRVAYLRTVKDEPNRVMNLGQLLHKASLEPDCWNKDVAICNEAMLGKNGAKNTKAYKEWALNETQLNPDIILSTPAEYEAVLGALGRYKDYPEIEKLFTNGIPEVSLFWETGFERDDFTGALQECLGSDLMLKTRPDYLRNDQVVVSLKTTAPSFLNPREWGRHAYNMKYHWSAFLAIWGLEILTSESFAYVEVVQSNEPPHDIIYCYYNDHLVNMARDEMMPVLNELKECHKKNEWPGRDYGLFKLEFPAWTHKKIKIREDDIYEGYS